MMRLLLRAYFFDTPNDVTAVNVRALRPIKSSTRILVADSSRSLREYG
jgi:hypothetical protein